MANGKLDLISRSALLELVQFRLPIDNQNAEVIAGCVDITRRIIENAPTVDAVPVVHGHWAHLGGDEWCCTVCGEVIHTEGSWEKPDKKFCYECGAKMDGGNEDG